MGICSSLTSQAQLQLEVIISDRHTTMVTENLPLRSRSGNLLISQRDQVFDAFRRWGHLQAKLDPLEQYLLPKTRP